MKTIELIRKRGRERQRKYYKLHKIEIQKKIREQILQDVAENKWIRNCPKCNQILSYISKGNRDFAERKNRNCRKCTSNIFKTPKILNRFCPKCNKKLIYSRNSHRNKAERVSSICRSCSSSKLQHTEVAKQKIRIAHINAIKYKYGKIFPNYNITACKIFDEINKELGWEGMHAENGGEFHIKELGYFVDYYEPNLNIVIEYDEKHHQKNKQKKKDIYREHNIKQHLNCKFYRIKHTDTKDDILKVLAQPKVKG